MASGRSTGRAGFYDRSLRAFHHFLSAERALFVGTWLGLLDRESLQAFDQAFYERETLYHSEAYNLSGLFGWEALAVEKHFRESKRLLVAAAGAGRETIALEKLGHQVDAFECHPELAGHGNELLERSQMKARIVEAPRDECPSFDKVYDGIIIGWSGYMLVQHRHRRIHLLQQLREHVDEGAPLLLSFHYRAEKSQHHKAVAAISSPIRRLRRREPIELGDDLAPNFMHCFTEDEIRAELGAGGFRMEQFSTTGYGHAVAVAVHV
jgi:hypothetical protein